MNLDVHQRLNKRLTQFLYLSIIISPFLPPVALLVIGIITPFIYKGKWSVTGWPEGVFAGFALLSLVSWYFNPSYFFWIPIGIIPIMAFIFLYLLSVWIRHVVKWSWRDVQKVYIAFWLGGFYVAAIVILQYVDWPVINESWFGSILDFYNEFRWQSERSSRPVGTSGNSNLTAALLICFSLMSIYVSSVLTKIWQKMAAFSSLLVFGFAIWCTGSRGAWVGLVIGLIVQLWMTGHRKPTLGITLLLIGLVTLFPTLIPRNDTLSSTISIRFKVWSNALEIFQDHWVVGTLPLHFGQIFAKKTGVYMYHAHNVILGVATEYGIIGLALFLALVFMTIRRARLWRKAANNKEEKRLAGMLISQTIALLGHGMYDYPIVSPQVGVLFMLSIMIIHTQYERRCLKRPKWSESEKGEAKNPVTYTSISAFLLLIRTHLFRHISEWIVAVRKRA